MSIGMSAVMFLVSLGYGLQEELLKRITTADTIYTLTVRAPQGREELLMLPEKIEEFKAFNGVAEVAGARLFEGSGRVDGLISNLTISFSDDAYFRLSGARSAVGNLSGSGSAGEVVITTGTARMFNKDPADFVGKDLEIQVSFSKEKALNAREEISYQSFRVRGVIQAEENAVYVPLESFSAEIGALPFDDFRVRMHSKEDIEKIRNIFVQKEYDVSAIADTVQQVETFFTVVQFILGFFGIIALFVSAIGMFNTMTVALLERTQEIGIMKSIGATDRYIAVLFMIESFLMGVFGGLLGIIIAYIEMAILNGAVNILATRLGGQAVDLFATPMWFITLIFVFSGVVGIITGLIPARRASKLDTLTALQYK
jgi:ABC-type antimicrobial peptide transport system permease subunit